MTDRRDPEAEELRDLLAELESTLVELRGELDAADERPRIPRGLPGGGRPAPRPPRLREVLRFTEEYTIPTLISILEANIRLLRFGGAALRALDPQRSTVPTSDDGAVMRAIDAGRGLSTDRLQRGLEDLNDALAGTETPDPEARALLSNAEELSAEIQERLRSAGETVDGHGGDVADTDETVHVDVAEASDAAEVEDAGSESPSPDVDAELDSIRQEVRGDDGAEDGEPSSRGENDGATEPSDDAEEGDDADGTALE
ncbi:MAG: DUF7547 family protein [Halolamina sp.]